MYLEKVHEERFYSEKKNYSEADFDLSGVLTGDAPFKLTFEELNSLELFDEFELSKDNCSRFATKFDDNSIVLSLPKGQYIINYKSGGVLSKTTGRLNDCIYTTSPAAKFRKN